MKKRLYDIVQFCESAPYFADLTGHAGFAVTKTMIAARASVELFTSKRDALIKKYGEDEDKIAPSDPHWPEFYAEYQELCNTEVEIDGEMLPADTTIDAFRCDSARMQDYAVVMGFLVEKGIDHETEQE